MRLTKGFLSFLLGCELSCQSVLGTFRSWSSSDERFSLGSCCDLDGERSEGGGADAEGGFVDYLVGWLSVGCLSLMMSDTFSFVFSTHFLLLEQDVVPSPPLLSVLLAIFALH